MREELNDGDVATLARQAVELLAEDIEVSVEKFSHTLDCSSTPDAGWDGWLVWPLVDGHRSFGMFVSRDMTPAQALARILDDLSENVSETNRFWAVAFPNCPGHRHAAMIGAADEAVVLSCPSSGAEVERLRPEVSS